MKKYFFASLCKNGVLGGGIAADDEAITYRTGKLTVPEAYKNLKMRYGDIAEVCRRNVLIFPGVLLRMRDGEEYRFIVFCTRSFISVLREHGVEYKNTVEDQI